MKTIDALFPDAFKSPTIAKRLGFSSNLKTALSRDSRMLTGLRTDWQLPEKHILIFPSDQNPGAYYLAEYPELCDLPVISVSDEEDVFVRKIISKPKTMIISYTMLKKPQQVLLYEGQVRIIVHAPIKF